MPRNAQWLLHSRPEGMVSEANFEYFDAPLPELKDGQALVRTLYLAFEPAMRGWMNDAASYVAPVKLGEVMRGAAVAQVVESRRPDFKAGDIISGMFGWQQYAIVDGALDAAQNITRVPDGVPPHWLLSVLGITGLTAYFGMLEVGKLRAGDTVLVSAAAGATGSVAAQLARIGQSEKVVGIAGSPRKCAWLTEQAKLDAALDYRSENLNQRLREEFPDGISLFFDNVGGDVLDTALLHMAQNGRVVLCGGISQYNTAERPAGPANYMQIVLRRLTVKGFILFDWAEHIGKAQTELRRWLSEGRIAHAEDIQQGFENAPRTFLRLFSGENLGKQLLKIADPD